MKLLGISGSLRKGSYNTALLENAGTLMPEGVALTLVGCADIPHYNKDLDTENKPEEVLQFLQAIRYADGVLFATPEYNYSFSGVLKNAIDWASRPAYKSVLAGKPVAIVSGSQSLVGGARAQSHLRQVLSATLSPVLPSPPFLVPMVQDKIDGNGLLTDEDTRCRLARYIIDFIAWVNRLAGR